METSLTLKEQHTLSKEQVGKRYFELKQYVTTSKEQLEHTKTELLKERRTTEQLQSSINAHEDRFTSLHTMYTR